MFDSAGWTETKEQELDNLAPATGVAIPIPPHLQLGLAYTTLMVRLWTPWWLRR